MAGWLLRGWIGGAAQAPQPPAAQPSGGGVAAAPGARSQPADGGRTSGSGGGIDAERAAGEWPAVDPLQQLLWERLEQLEQRLGRLERRWDEDAQATAPGGQAESAQSPEAAATEEGRGGDRRARLVAAGIEPYTADLIEARLQENELQRLYLRDRAVREGWFATPRYREAVEQLSGGDAELRTSLDENDYDRYLYATGQPNRLVVGTVMIDSAAAASGLKADDVLYRYAGERVFNTDQLRDLSAAGVAGEPVAVEVWRGQDLLQFYLPRGPLGVRLNFDRVPPS